MVSLTLSYINNMKKINNSITDPVADTLFIPLVMKCKETKRKDSVFKDPFSSELMDRIDYDFSKYDKAIRSSIGVAIRAAYFDRYTKTFIQNNPNAVIVHVGCGLDTRYKRLADAIEQGTYFYELDLPQVIELRKSLMPEGVYNQFIAASMFETDWMDHLKDKHPDSTFLFVIEGVLMFFETEQVKSVIQNLSSRFNNSRLIFDVVNSWMCKNSHRHDAIKLSKTSFKWGCDDDKQLENWADNLQLESSKLYTDFKAWRKAGIMNYLMASIIPTIKKAGRILTYKVE